VFREAFCWSPSWTSWFRCTFPTLILQEPF
jgi:hypothetical protein